MEENINKYIQRKKINVMRMILYISKKAKRLIALLFFFASIGAYPQTCEVTLRNDFLVDANNLIVDIYVKATSGNFYYSQGQYKAQFDISIKNGGTITGAIVPGYSDLTNSTQIPTTVNMTTSTFRVPAEFQPATQAACSQISTTGFGTRICRVKLTNSVAFGVVTADMTLLTTIGVPTTVWYTNSSNFGVKIPTTLVNTNLVNPILNGTLTAYNVIGSGTAPSSVGLDGSQTGGVNYVLYKSDVPQGASIDGTGSAITFGTQPEGTYTVKGHRIATFIYSDMAGNAIVTSPDPTAYAVTGGGFYCQGGVGLPVGLANSEPGVIYTLIKNGVDQVSTVTGTGAHISFGNQLFGTYTVRGTNGSGTIAMEGSAIITVNTTPGAPTVGTITQPTCVVVTGSVVLSGLPATGTWTLTRIPGGTTATGTGISSTITGLAAGTYTYIVSNSSGCTSAASTNVVFEVAEIGVVPKIKVKFGDLLICYNLGDSIKSYQWYKGVDPISNATTQYYQTKGQSGTYKVGTIDKNWCVNFSNEISTSGTKSLSVYPNPASVSFSLKLNDESEGRAMVSIINSTGIKVMEFQVENINDEMLKEIPVNNLDEGIYFVRVLLNQKDLYYTKIVVIK